MQNKGYYAVQSYSRSSKSVSVESPYATSKISGRRGRPHSSSQKTTLNDLSYGIKSLPFCHNSRVWRTYRLTDRILIARPRMHSMQCGKNYLIYFWFARFLLFLRVRHWVMDHPYGLPSLWSVIVSILIHHSLHSLCDVFHVSLFCVCFVSVLFQM